MEVDASKALAVTAHWLSEKEMAVHLDNCTRRCWVRRRPVTSRRTGEERRPFLFQMAPLADIGIRFNAMKTKRSTAAISETMLDVKDNHLGIPSVGHGEAVIFELK